MWRVFYILILGMVAFAANPFHVDPNSINKQQYSWSMKLIRSGGGNYPKPVSTAHAVVESLDKSVIRIKIINANEKRWEAPLINSKAGANYVKTPLNNMGFALQNNPFGFKIVDPTTNKLVADMTSGSFEFADRYLEIGMTFSGDRIMGIGERVTKSFLLCSERQSCTYILWGKDAASPLDDENGHCSETYGQQPFFLYQLHNTNLFAGSFLLNSNDRTTTIDKQSGSARITQKMIGGIFDIYFFYPGKAEFVLQKYHELIGKPYLPPLWSLGYHQCRYGWKNLAKVKEVVTKFSQSDLPLDVVWADIDYMKDYADFTVDKDRYNGLKEFVSDLHKKKMRWVPIIDAGLKYDVNDKYYKLGQEHGAFIKSAFTKKTLIGKVWPGHAVFLSWYNPYSTTLWDIGLTDLYNLVNFDGIWIDMNEIANFCRGECPPGIEAKETKESLTADPHDPKEFDDLPYKPGNCDITTSTVSMTGYHHSTNNDEDRLRKEYNTHSVWNLYEAKATYNFLKTKLNQRPYVLTRSNFPGSGLFTTKWLGDNHSTWDSMRYSLPGMFAYQLFGMPFVGSDMCGFLGETNEELCARWMQLGAFYPFTRNHNDIHSKDQEPYVFGERVMTATRNAMRQKYSIMMYYYTKVFEASLHGGSIVRPLFFEFPDDPGMYSKTDFMFMIGSSLLIPPVLHPGLTKTYPYCANEDWYNLKNFEKVVSYDPNAKQGKQIELEADFKYVNVLVRGGSIIPYQDASKVRVIETLKSLDMELIIAPNHVGKAAGTLVIDDGISLGTIEKGHYRYLRFDFDMKAATMKVTMKKEWDGATTTSERVSEIMIFGADKWASINKACLATKHGKITMAGSYNSAKKNLKFTKPSAGVFWKDVTQVTFANNC